MRTPNWYGTYVNSAARSCTLYKYVQVVVLVVAVLVRTMEESTCVHHSIDALHHIHRKKLSTYQNNIVDLIYT